MLANKNDVGLAVLSVRKAKKLRQNKLAEMIGVKPLHLCQVERGNKRPSLEMLENIAIKTNTTLIITFVEKPTIK